MRFTYFLVTFIYLILMVMVLFGCERKFVEVPNKQVSCSVVPEDNGLLITCPDGTEARISNGINGVDGRDGEDAPVDPYRVTEFIDPCGPQSTFDEVLLRLANGDLLAHYAGNGNKQFLTLLHPGNYITTDSTNCYFTVHNDYSVTW